MKALKKFLILGFLTLSVIGCKKDPVFTLVGQWNVETISVDILVNDMFKIPTQELTDNGTVEFREDNTGTFAKIGKFTWTQVKSHLIIEFITEGDLTIPALDFDLTTMEPEKVVGATNFSIVLNDLDGIGDWIDLPSGIDWDLIFGDDGLHLSIDLECVLGKD